MEEIWKDIKDYEGLYQISNLGRVKSLEKVTYHGSIVRRRPEMIMKQRLTKRGYLEIILCKNSIQRIFKVHRLVAEAFISNDDPTNKTTINHKDECKINNYAENLEWMSPYDNYIYGTGRERSISKRTSGLNSRARKVLQINKDTNEIIKEYNCINDAVRELNISTHVNIVNCCKDKIKTAYGFKWKYV